MQKYRFEDLILPGMPFRVLVTTVPHNLPGEWKKLISPRQQSRNVLADLGSRFIHRHLEPVLCHYCTLLGTKLIPKREKHQRVQHEHTRFARRTLSWIICRGKKSVQIHKLHIVLILSISVEYDNQTFTFGSIFNRHMFLKYVQEGRISILYHQIIYSS